MLCVIAQRSCDVVMLRFGLFGRKDNDSCFVCRDTAEDANGCHCRGQEQGVMLVGFVALHLGS